jgi:hypothetical protein
MDTIFTTDQKWDAVDILEEMSVKSGKSGKSGRSAKSLKYKEQRDLLKRQKQFEN